MERGSSARLRFSKARRLILPSEFSRVKAEGIAQRGSLMVLGVLETGDGNFFRAGFVTSKKIGGAVIRNRTRRRLREIIRRHQSEIRRGFWLVVIARPAAAQASSATLEHEWLRLARGASILAP